jgi:hypothetical protein
MPAKKRQPLGDGTEEWHGTNRGYRNGCGCEPCTRAHADVNLAWLHSNTEKAEQQRQRNKEAYARGERGDARKVLERRKKRQQTEQLIAAAAAGARLRPGDSEMLRGEPPSYHDDHLVADAAQTEPVHLLTDASASTVCGENGDTSWLLHEVTCRICRSVPHSRHTCLHCGCTIERKEPEAVIMGRGIYSGQRRYFHALQKDCMNAARAVWKHQNMVVSGGLVRGKR